MSASIFTIRAVGTTFGCRQERIAAMEDGDPVFFKPEPGNKYDPLAVAIINESGEHLGYIGRNDNSREEIRHALSHGFVVARAQKVGGFKKYDGSTASYGLRIQWYAVSALYGMAENMNKDEEDVAVTSPRKNTAQQRKEYEGAKYKGKEIRKHYAGARSLERVDAVEWKALSRKRRHEFKRGNDIKATQLAWHYGLYVSPEEAREFFMERRVG